MDLFKALVSSRYNIDLDDYAALHAWSIDEISAFWKEVWEWPAFGAREGQTSEGVVSSKKWDTVINLAIPMDEIPPWFTGAKLNWAQNMLRCRSEDQTALIETSEPPPGSPLSYKKVSYAELYRNVHTVALALSSLGLKKNSILGYYGPTSTASVILLLAATSIGAIWSSSSADFGSAGVIERFEQFGEKLWGIVGVESVRYNGKILGQREKLATVVDGLMAGRSQTLEVVIVDYLGLGAESVRSEDGWRRWEDLIGLGETLKKEKGGEIEFAQLPFDHPLWCLFSSGTTGKPKAIVHRAGGMLLQSKKEHLLHGDMGPADVFFYYTTPGWMMYNYLISGLSTGCTLVLFDGSPLFRPALLWEMTESLGVTIFGTSAKYIDVLSKNYSPKSHHNLTKLKQVLSTGSPLKPDLFDWVYTEIKADLLLGSITGGTDICSLFSGHNASLPVIRGEIQCICLGMAVESWDEAGQKAAPGGEPGDLVCVKPFPCMPIFFWNDVGNQRYHASYFEKFDGVWAHGDFCVISASQEGNGGGLLMLGRSDGVLNPSGIRFGSSEIYEVIDTFSPSEGKPTEFSTIEDSLVIGQKTQDGADERVVLFVKMIDGASLTNELLQEIRRKIRATRSARHVPERIIQVIDIPHTINGKKVEIPIKKLLGGAPISSINFSTLRNPKCLEEYVVLGKMLRKEVQ